MNDHQTARKRPRIAVIGTGQWGLNHVRTWAELGHLATVCDSEDLRLELARRIAPSARSTTSVAEVLGDESIDAVVLAVPARLHEELAVAALTAGKDVLIEKPLALTAEGGRHIERVARETGRIAAVGHLLEYHPAFLEIRRLLAAGTLGRLQYIYSHRLNLGRFRTEENALWSFAPHDVALILRLTGEAPATVACHGGTYLSMGIADVTTTHLSFPSNVRAHIFVSWLHPFKEHRFVVVGSEGMVVFDDTRDWPEKLVLYPHGITWEDGQAPVARRADALQVKLTEEEPLRAECEDFIRAIMTRQEALVSASTGVQVLDVLERAERVLGGHPAPVLRAPSADVFIHPTAVVDEDVHIGDRTKIWHYGHLSSGAAIGNDSSLGQNVYVGPGVVIGNRVRVQNNVSVYEGVELEDGVFCGPSMVFTNVRTPRAEVQRSDAFAPTLVRQGATLGANSTILCGTTIGRFAMVGAGAVVTRDVADHALVVGVPAKRIGWVCSCGERIDGNGRVVCGRCRRAFLISKDALHPNEEASGS